MTLGRSEPPARAAWRSGRGRPTSEELGGLIPLLFVLVFLPGLCVAVTRQAADGLIGRNGSAGIRTRYTKASEEAWVAGHRAALPVVKRMWPVAGVGVAAALAVQIAAGAGWGIGAAFLALIVQTVILLCSASAANGAARAAGGAADA